MGAQPFLTGPHVSLRPVEEADLPFVAGLRNDPTVRATMYWHEPVNERQARSWWERVSDGENLHLVVVPTGGEDPVGLCSMGEFDAEAGTAELGYAIVPDSWGEGYATAATELLCAYGFEERRLAKLSAMVYATNPASVRVLEKAGFTEEGRLRRQAFVGGERVDVLVFGLLREEWVTRRDADTRA